MGGEILTGNRECATGKMRYLTLWHANKALAKIRQNRIPGHSELHSHFCMACRGWHLTSHEERAI